MIAYVKAWNRSPWEKFLGHTRVVNLVYDYIELINLRQCIHLQLACPLSILPDPIDIVFNALIILNEKLVQFFILFNVFHSLLPQICLPALITQQLVSDRSKKTVPISFYLTQFKPILAELLPKLDKIILILLFIHLRFLSSHLLLCHPVFILLFLLFFSVLGFCLLLLV